DAPCGARRRRRRPQAGARARRRTDPVLAPRPGDVRRGFGCAARSAGARARHRDGTALPMIRLDLDLYRRIVREGEPVEIPEESLRAVDERRAAMLRALEAGASAYGV